MSQLLFRRPSRVAMPLAAALVLALVAPDPGHSAAAGGKSRPSSKTSPAVLAATRYAEAVASGDRVAAGQLDFACLYRMVAGGRASAKGFPPASDPIYAACWQQLAEAHASAVESNETGVDTVWPGKGSLVFFKDDLARYPASAFVMDLLGTSPPGGGLRLEAAGSRALPASSFRLRPDGPMLAAPATLVALRVSYKDPLTSPLTYAPGAYKFTNTVKRPRQAVKALTVQWAVLSGLKKHGFPTDLAVVNLPVQPAQGTDGRRQPAVPFLTETSRFVPDSTAWWTPTDAPGILLAAVGRASHFPERKDRLAMLNRVLLVDPQQGEALTALTRDLYDALLADAAAAHGLSIPDPVLARRFNELYWDVYAQTWRMDISLGMEVGGFTKPTSADYLYRMIPAMERLAKVRPGDLENRLRLGIAYRWNNDQLAAIDTHEALLRDLPPKPADLRARGLTQLAMSRIARISWNRTFDDPGIGQAYKEAEEAFALTDEPLEKFSAAYTMAYAQAFMPNRDNQTMLERLQDAQRWYLQLAGASPQSWRYLLANDTLKGVLEADPLFKPLLAAS